MTGWGSVEMAVEAMRRGARGFVEKPWDNRTLLDSVKREVTQAHSVRLADERAQHDWEEAAIIQRALLPAVLPSIRHCEFAARWQPAAGLGGDCYDLLQFTETRAGVSIADVIGKGVSAALLMSSLQTSLRAFAAEYVTPAEVTTRVNRLLCRGIAVGKFVSFCYSVLDTRTGRVAFCNAGHNPPVLIREDGAIERLWSTGMVLGVQSDGVYQQGETTLEPGDRLVMFTDGITEAMQLDGEQFGDGRLVETAVASRRGTAAQMLDTILSAVSRFTGGSFQDDATLIVAAMS
jgi:sigma-B regulation protein RsbU (phosphoserine phosphatase)